MFRSRSAAVIAMLVAATVFATWEPTRVAAVPAGHKLVSSDRQLFTDGLGFPANMCVGEKWRARFGIADIAVFANASGGLITTTRGGNGLDGITADSSNPAALSVSPGVIRLGKSIRARTGKPFVVTALKPGHATLTFADFSGVADPFVYDVDVEHCHYEVSLDAKWSISFGFRPTLHSWFGRVELRPTSTGLFYEAKPNMANQATAPDFRGCSVTYDVLPSSVTIRGVVGTGNKPTLTLTFLFDEVKATPYVCHEKPQYGVGAGSGTPRKLTFIFDPTAPVTSRTVSHTLDAGGAWTGRTTITVYKLPN